MTRRGMECKIKKKKKRSSRQGFGAYNLRHILFWYESYPTLALIFSRAPIVIEKFG
jgi:hypothetical protein